MKSESDEKQRPVRRHHERAFKDEMVRQCLEPGASVSAIALRAGINSNLLFKWRREYRCEQATGQPLALLPVQVLEGVASLLVQAISVSMQGWYDEDWAFPDQCSLCPSLKTW